MGWVDVGQPSTTELGLCAATTSQARLVVEGREVLISISQLSDFLNL